MQLHSLFRRPLVLSAVIAIGAAVAVSSFGIVRADLITPDKSKNAHCNKSGVCVTITNASGPAQELASSSTNTRALYIYATASGSDAADANGGYIGLIGRAPSGGTEPLFPLVLTDQHGTNLDYTDTNGNIFYAGALSHFAVARDGQRVVTYGCQSTTQTLEDVGSARLMNGVAYVRLHRTFAQSIELQADPYRVFLTPNGDTRGLYVAQKLTNGFIVRETERGRGTLDFDYRIVATALGHAGERSGVTALAAEPRAPVNH